ncbi:NPCBM/NEW2 domain-containing protein [Schlesneria sp. T3-172]|uniref:NPCBM/NEW2 domain-containing protein n=1 Tax=Schlesneria sphaerica TaxID=3373610 RepID=UPI0037C81E29
MHYGVILICLAMNQTPAVEVVTLSEKQVKGTIESLTANEVVIKSTEGAVVVPVSELLTIRSSQPVANPATDGKFILKLTDESQLGVSSFISAGNTVTVGHAVLGDIQMPLTAVSSVRFAPADPKVDQEWNQLLERSVKKDLLAIRKGDVLDHLDGIIGSLNDTTLQFQLDGDDLSVKRERAFGLIYSKRDSTSKKATARLELVTGDRLSARQVEWNGKKWRVRLVTGPDLEVAPEQLSTLDFSQSKITYLSDLDPRSVKYTPYFNYPGVIVWEYKKDRAFEGKPMFLGKVEYRKGLAIHSQTQLRFRLGGEYRKFQAAMGIGDEIQQGDASVIVKADERVIFNGSAKTRVAEGPLAGQRPEPQKLDLDVTGVVELEIFVGFGSEGEAVTDIGDRVYFGNARLLR